MRPLINENLKMDTLNYWLKMIKNGRLMILSLPFRLIQTIM